MSQREGKPAPRGPRRNNGAKGRDGRDGRDGARDARDGRDGRDRDDRDARSRDRKRDANEGAEERKFVPWLGEARPKRGPIYDFEAKLGSRLSIQFLNGRTIEGVLVSYDKFMNLVLDDTVEILDDGKSRKLGKVFSCGRVEALSEVPQ